MGDIESIRPVTPAIQPLHAPPQVKERQPQRERRDQEQPREDVVELGQELGDEPAVELPGFEESEVGPLDIAV